VRRTATFGVTSGLIWIAAVLAVSAGPRTGYFAQGSAPRSPEVMLYFSHSVGAGGAARPTFGLKVDQLRQGANSGDPLGGDVMQRRELVNWQMEAHSNMHISDLRVRLGHRVTYDLTNRAFGSPETRSTLQIGVPSMRASPPGASQPKPLSVQASALGSSSTPSSSSLQREPFRDNSALRVDNSALREIANAAMAALSPPRFTSAQRQMVPRQGITGQQRLAPVRGGYGNQ
jgi:hypothetical protein